MIGRRLDRLAGIPRFPGPGVRGLCTMAGSALLTVTAAWAGPQGGEIVGGQGSISRSGGSTTIIRQETGRMAINWASFNVAAHERVVFQQPSASATALNRILDANPSRILGAIDANGRVFLLNRNGIVFGRNARVNLQSLVASSLDMSVSDFMAGNYKLQSLADREGGLIVNRGVISAATGGSVTLVGGAVRNEGVILADYGEVNLGAGRAATLDFDGEGLMLFRIDESVVENAAGVPDAVRNSGRIVADGGQVLLTAQAASDVFSNVVNNTGVVRARRIDTSGGVVRLTGSGGTVAHSGRIDVSGAGMTDSGGRAELLGDRVGLFGDARVDASGAAGGGEVYVGGGVRGEDPTLANAEQSYVGRDASIDVSATVDGDGGTTVVWGNQSTQVYGDIAARGGFEGGDGGFVETSAAWLDVRRAPSLQARRGRNGLWLIDPIDLNIVPGSGDFTVGDPSPFSSGDGSDLGVDVIRDALDSGNVLVETDNATAGNGDITWQGDADFDFDELTGQPTLTLDADGTIFFSDGLVIADSDATDANPNPLDLTLIAGGGVEFQGNASVDLAGGDLTANFGSAGGSTFSVGASASVATANATITGDTGDDLFELFGTLIATGTAAVAGDGGSDELAGPDAATTWTIDGANTGSVSGVDFSAIENLTGGSDADVFDFADAATISGTVDGGAGTDTLDFADYTTANTWNITGGSSGTVNGIGFALIENLTGGGDADVFAFTQAGVILGTVDGGAGSDTLDYSARTTAITISPTAAGSTDGLAGDETQNNTVGVFDNIDDLVGTGAGTDLDRDRLQGPNAANMWTISSNDQVVLDFGAGPFTFDAADFPLLFGGSLVDTFTVNANWTGSFFGNNGADFFTLGDGVTVTGQISGNALGDTFDLGNNVTVTGPVGGGVGDDDYTVGTGVDAALNGGADTDSLTGPDAANDWMVTGADSGTLNTDASFSGIDNVFGGSDVDDFVFADGASVSGTVDGGLGSDILDWGAYTTALVWDLTANDAGSVDGTDFIAIESLVGGGAVDTFDFADGVTISGTLAGGAGSDEIDFGDYTTANTWNVTGGNSGDVNGIGFSGIENLTGGSGTDDFVFAQAGLLLGNVDGATGTDTLDYSGRTTAITISPSGAGSADGLAGDETQNNTLGVFDNIDDIVGTGAGTGLDRDRLQGPNQAAAWTINVNDQVVLDFGDGPFTFDAADFPLLLGGSQVDTFTVNANWTGDFFGNSGMDVFNLGAGVTLTGQINGNADNDALTLGDNVTVTGPVAGGFGDDGFTVGTGVTATLVGGQDNDTLSGPNAAGTWALAGADGGTLNTTVGFSEFENLIGGSNTDDFQFADGATVSGSIDGGADLDTLDWNAYTTPITVALSDAGSTDGLAGAETQAATIGDFDNIDAFVGSGNGDTLQGPDLVSSWTFNLADMVVLDFGSGPFTFDAAAFPNLVGGGDVDTFTISAAWNGSFAGGAGADTFAFADGGSVTGTVDGGDDGDTLDYSARTAAVTVALTGPGGDDGLMGLETQAATLNGFDNIDVIVGSGTGDTLQGPDITSIWSVSATDQIELSLGGDTFGFAGFLNVLGGSLVDIFTVSADWSGDLDGGAGNDSLTVERDVTVGGDVIGGDGNDQLAIAGGASVNQLLGGNDTDTLTLTDPDPDTPWMITSAQGGTVGGVVFDQFESLIGGALADQFTINVSFSGDISGGDGDDLLALDAGATVASLLGGNGSDTLQLLNAGPVTNWMLDSAAGGMVGTQAFDEVEEVIGGGQVDNFAIVGAFAGDILGGDGDDTFLLDGGLDVGRLAGGGGSDTLTLNNPLAQTNWIIDGEASGSVGGETFEEMELLEGGDAVDIFAITASFMGDIAGGDGDDQFQVDGGVGGGLLAGGAGSDSLTLTNPGMTTPWQVDSDDGGLLDGKAFDEMEALFGGDQTDTFAITASFTGDIDGGDGADSFTLDGGLTVGTLAGGAGTDTLTLANPAAAITNWVVDSADGGTVDGQAFTAMESLVGGDMTDAFAVDAAFAGELRGGDGDDEFTLAAGANAAGGLFGGDGDDSLLLSNAAGENRNVAFFGEGGSDSVQIDGAAASGSYSVGSSTLAYDDGAGSVQTLALDMVEGLVDTTTSADFALLGSGGGDDITLGAGAAAGSDPLTVEVAAFVLDLANKTNLAVTGGAGADSATVTSDITLPGEIAFDVETLATTGGAVIGAGTLTIVGAQIAAPLSTRVDTLDLSNMVGDVTIVEEDGVSLAQALLDGASTFTLQTGAALSVDGAVSGADAVSLMAGGAIAQTAGAITTDSLVTTSVGGATLDQAGNAVSAFAATNNGAGAISFRTATGLGIGDVMQSGGGAVTLRSGGAITQTGDVTASGGNITVQAANGINMGTTTTSSGNGNIAYATGSGGVTLSVLNGGSGNVSIDTSTGSIVSGIDGINIFAGQLVELNAPAGLVGQSEKPIVVLALPESQGGLIRGQSAQRAVLSNLGNSAEDFPGGVIDFVAARAQAAANASTAVGTSVEELEFAPGTEVTPFTVVPPGLALPCDQLEEEDPRCQ